MLVQFAHSTTTSEMIWVADVIYKWSFVNMNEKEAAVCVLLALLVDDEEKKTRGPTQTASLNLFLMTYCKFGLENATSSTT